MWSHSDTYSLLIIHNSYFLDGRSIHAIHSRWKRTLRHIITGNQRTGADGIYNTTVNKTGEWTEAEDAIIMREHTTDPSRWVINTMKYLPNRTRDAIRGRWRDMLKYKSIVRARVTSKAPWTKDEDLIILSERMNCPKTYIDQCVVALPTRTVRSIRLRWNDILRHRYPDIGKARHSNYSSGIESNNDNNQSSNSNIVVNGGISSNDSVSTNSLTSSCVEEVEVVV